VSGSDRGGAVLGHTKLRHPCQKRCRGTDR
jgi:hypothetical protein